ncbi:MAG TPA: radical SAM protein [Planctomycetota bacterium]|nr:radical SAM protein [Planctomycetota bacterium]
MVRKDELVDYDPATGVCRTTPRQVFLELTPRCNLACVHCSKDYGLPHPEDRDMSAATLQTLAPWLLQANSVNLNLVGEPLIAEQFDAALALCARGTASVGFNTNGLGLTPATCDRIVAARVDSVVVSIDGLESNLPIRGVPYAILRDRLLALHAAKVRAGSALPHLGVAMTLMRRNLHELPRLLADLLPRVPLDYVHLQPLIEFWETMRGQNPYLQPEAADVVRRARAQAGAHGVELTLFRSNLLGDEAEGHDGEALQLGQRSSRFGCNDPFYEVKVLASGAVQSCSWGLAGGFDVNTTPLDSIWNSDWYRSLRMRLWRREFTDRCHGCPYVFGSPVNQTSSLQAGVEHSRAARFRAGAVGRVPRALPPPVERPFLAGRPARPAQPRFGPGEAPPRG